MSPTEQDSYYHELHTASLSELLTWMNAEDWKVAEAVQAAQPQIEALLAALVPRMQEGGRLFYLGAGTSGRLGVLDASECPPTFGVEPGLVVGIIAGGDVALRTAVEGAEDNPKQGWADVAAHSPHKLDTLIGISASGNAAYVVGALEAARAAGMLTGAITMNAAGQLASAAAYPIIVNTGPEFLTGSTRLKAGTATKLVLNQISTVAMVRLGRVRGNKMVDMQLANDKLVERGTRMVMELAAVSETVAREALLAWGSVRAAVKALTS